MKWLLVAGILVYSLTIFNGFVGDDIGYIGHPYIQKFQLGKLVMGSSSDLGGLAPITGQFYRPMMMLVLASGFLLFGQNAWGYHLMQIGLVIINSFLAYFVFRRFFNKRMSLILAVIFLVHPINAETALYISNFQEVLMMTAGLMALLSNKWQVTMSGLLAAMLAKETGGGFVIMAWYLKKISWKQGLLLTGGYMAIRTMAGVGIGGGIPRLFGFSPELIWYYIRTFFFPIRLAIAQTWIPQNNPVSTMVFAGGLVILTVILIKNRQYRLWAGWMILGFVPHLQIVPLEMTVADRWFYFSSMGLIGIIGLVGKNINKYVWIGIIFLLSIRTILRVQDFRTYERLLTRDSQVTESYLLEQALGYVKNSKEHTQKSIDLRPNPVNTNTMGYLYFHEGNIVEAKRWFGKSIELGDNFQAYNNLIRILLSEERWEEAKPIILQGKAKFPQVNLFDYFESYMLERQNGK